MDGSKAQGKKPFPYLRVLGTLLAVGLLVYLLAQQGWDEILDSLKKISPVRFLLAFGLTLVSRLAVSGRWYALLKAAGAPVTAWQAVKITFGGLFASNFLPTTIGGDVARLAGAIRLGCDRPMALASLIVDRLVGMVGMALAVPLSLPAILAKGSAFPPGFFSLERLGVLSGIGAGGGMESRLEKLPGTGKRLFRKLVEAVFLWRNKPEALLASLGFTFAHMLCHFGSIALVLGGMGDSMPLWSIAGAWSLTYFITLLPVSVNGLGVQELAVTVLFAWLGSVSTPSAATLSVLVRVFQMFASLPGAAAIPEMVEGKAMSDRR